MYTPYYNSTPFSTGFQGTNLNMSIQKKSFCEICLYTNANYFKICTLILGIVPCGLFKISLHLTYPLLRTDHLESGGIITLKTATANRLPSHRKGYVLKRLRESWQWYLLLLPGLRRLLQEV